MSNDKHALAISKMTELEVLQEVYNFPDGMTDGYFRWFRVAVEKRMAELKTAPTAVRKPLTDDEIIDLLRSCLRPEIVMRLPPGWKNFARAIEAAHGITQQEPT
jgi:hypothetical protein